MLLTGLQAGISEWHLLTWHDAVRVHASLADEPKLKDVVWHVHDMYDPAQAPLADILPAEDVIVIACSAAFDQEVIRLLQMCSGITLCVTHADASGAKDIPVTILRCYGTLLGAIIDDIRETPQAQVDPLQHVISELMNFSDVRILDISPYVWVPMAAPLASNVAIAECALLRQTGRPSDSLLVRLLDRRLSRFVSKRLIHTRLQPNSITVTSACIGVCGALLLALPVYSWQLLGSLLFLLSTILDGCDGEIARLTFQASLAGGKLDVLMDNVVHLILFPAIALGLYRQHTDPRYLVLGGIALGGVLLSMAVYLPYVWRHQHRHDPKARLHESLASRDFAYALPILVWLHKLHWFLWGALVGSYLFAFAWLAISWHARYRQRSRPGTSTSS
jgi:phosphatidylglycerophosphate synthase